MTDGPPSTERRVRSEGARRRAIELAASLRARHPRLAVYAGIDLVPALEQRLFFALRDGEARPLGWWRLRTIAAYAAAGGASFVDAIRPTRTRGTVVALVRSPAQLAILREVVPALAELSGRSVQVVRLGPGVSVPEELGPTPGLQDLLQLGLLPDLAALGMRIVRDLPGATRAWPDAARRSAALELPRIGLAAMGLVSLVRRWRPVAMVALDEVGTWARLIPEVARQAGIPSIDLPHAEAADSVAIAGIRYDQVAVYGRQAADVMARAGVSDDAVAIVGAPRFDPLIRTVQARAGRQGRVADPVEQPGRSERTVVYAAGYVTGAMTPDGLARSCRAAIAAAGALRPSRLIVRPHPASPTGEIAAIFGREPRPEGVTVQVDLERGLHELLLDADLLVTGWSNSVFEAAICGVPTVVVVPVGIEAPIDLAGDGFGVSAWDEASAAAAAARLLEPKARRDAVARATAALEARIGPLDGHAAERCARVILAAIGKAHDRSAGSA